MLLLFYFTDISLRQESHDENQDRANKHDVQPYLLLRTIAPVTGSKQQKIFDGIGNIQASGKECCPFQPQYLYERTGRGDTRQNKQELTGLTIHVSFSKEGIERLVDVCMKGPWHETCTQKEQKSKQADPF